MQGPNIMDALNEELLTLAVPKEPAAEPEAASKVGSKKYLVEQIVRITEAAGLPLQDSCRDMMRMKKQQLQGLVTDYVAASQRKEMADRLGAKSSCDNVIAVSMVRMMHDTAMVLVEKGGDAMARRYDYTIQGFVSKMKEEPINEQLNDVLRELLAENADILQWTTNPGVRLCLIYIQALAFTARRVKPAQSVKDGAVPVGPEARAPDQRWSREPHVGGPPQVWEERALHDIAEAGSSSSSGDEA